MQWSAMKLTAAGFVHRKDINWDELQPLALDLINQALEVQENQAAISLPLAPSALAGFSEAALPSDFQKARAVFSGTQELTPSDIQSMLARGGFGMARFYAVTGMKIIATAASPLALVYSQRIPVLVADSDHNWLSDRYSGVLLYGLLVQAVQKIQDFDALENHRGEFDRNVLEANMNSAMSAGAEARTPYGQVSN